MCKSDRVYWKCFILKSSKSLASLTHLFMFGLLCLIWAFIFSLPLSFSHWLSLNIFLLSLMSSHCVWKTLILARLSLMLSSLQQQPTSIIYQIIITYLFHGNTFINYCLIPFRIKTFLDIFSPPLVFSTELEEKKKRWVFLIYILPYLMTSWSN